MKDSYVDLLLELRVNCQCMQSQDGVMKGDQWEGERGLVGLHGQ